MQVLEAPHGKQQLLILPAQETVRQALQLSATFLRSLCRAQYACIQHCAVVLTCVNGYFGERHCDMASRYGADVRYVLRYLRELAFLFIFLALFTLELIFADGSISHGVRHSPLQK